LDVTLAQDGLVGLDPKEAAERLSREGPNELPRAGSRHVWQIMRDVLAEPMFILLLAAGFIYLILGEKIDALVLLLFASLSIVITIIQEARSERVLDALRDLTSPRALVIRGGQRIRIPGREVVRGDLVLVSEGDRVPADALLLQARELQADESLLTGESIPVRKYAAENLAAPGDQPDGENLTQVFSGTMVVSGQGLAEVQAIGIKSAIGRIGRSLKEIETASPNLRRQTARITRIAAAVGLICCLIVFLLYGWLRGSWLKALLAGLALGMSMLPEEFPLVLTVFMVMGAWRMSQAKVLTRRASAIESLGEATVLCTDKTGTLTENRISVAVLQAQEEVVRPRENPRLSLQIVHLLETAVLASVADAYDPMDRAFQQLASSTEINLGRWALLRSYGIQPDLLAVIQIWQSSDGSMLKVAAKGAPEAIAVLCRLEGDAQKDLLDRANKLASDGMRVLAIAEASATELAQSPHELEFHLLGLAGLADPLRESVPAAVAACRAAGVRVVMITGDHVLTARAIARQAGLRFDSVVDGPAIARVEDDELLRIVERADIYARIVPEQKLRIVRALKKTGHIVAMTGDGVNDAPSLKAADIGIAMGGRGTDVAREAASLVLLNDDFGSIVQTLRLGRRIYDNLRKAMAYIVAVHVPIAGLALLPLFTGLPLIFAPVHIAFLEMVIDPICATVFEAETEESDVMTRPPRPPGAALFSLPLVVWSLLQGGLALLALAALYVLSLRNGLPEADARALTFVTLVFVDLALVLVNRSFSASMRDLVGRRNVPFVIVTLITSSVLLAIFLTPFGRELFHFGPLHWDDLTVLTLTVLGVVVVLESLKRLWSKNLAA
jgi:P-type Ca2+ transporter type 2C